MSFQRPAGYAGELSVADAYALLKDDKKAVLVDVRTQAEWAWVGIPDLSGIGKKPIFVEWASYPGMKPAADQPGSRAASSGTIASGATPAGTSPLAPWTCPAGSSSA